MDTRSVCTFGNFTFDPEDSRLVGPDGPIHIGHKAVRVLAALIGAEGRLLTRDKLFATAWDGLTVSESTLRTVIKELRRALGDESREPRFIESVYGRGYRFIAPITMVAHASAERADEGEPPAASSSGIRGIDRRWVLAGGVTLGVAGLAGAGAIWLQPHPLTPAVPPEVEPLVTRARDALDRGTDDDEDQAIGLMRRVVALAPHYADGWGLLGLANAVTSHFRERSLGRDLRAHAEAAARRALEIERGNGYGELALGVALPLIGAWSMRERHLERALAAAPTTAEVLEYAAVCKIFTGQASAALPLYDRMRRPFQPQTFANYCQALWRTNRLAELDRALDEAAALYPAQWRLWTNQLSIYLYGGQPDRALKMLGEPIGRPRDMDVETIAGFEEIARAIRDPHSALAEKVVARQVGHARRIKPATEAVRILASLGRIDEAVTVVEALYFGKGYVVADWDGAADVFTPEQRDTRVLFEPTTRLLRADPRFEPVISRLGLEAFWRTTGTSPDYRLPLWG